MTTFDPASLPNRFDFATAQPRLYAMWEQGRFFHAEPHPKRQPFSIVIPPPNVTGALHLGHALNNTLQDIQIRMKRMQGFNALWMPGTDHAGIATQAVVERRLREEEGKTRHDLGREELVRRIWEWKEQYEGRILSQLKQMGCSCDWERTRFTLDDTCARAVRQTFFDLFSQGLIYRGKRLVNWDTFLQTAVSDDEVFQETVKGHFWHFRYPVIGHLPGEPEFVTIATTRPETMLGDTAVAVHPDPARALDKAEQEARERLAKAPAKEKAGIEAQIEEIQRRRTEMLPGLIVLRDMAKAGRKLMLPLLNREIPLIADEWAKPELGTGCVKITPAHDPNDYQVWQRNKSIGLINILNTDGTLNAEAGKYQGLTIKKARDAVVADLDALELLGDVEDREIELPHSDRSKTPIEPYLADQWFVKMGDHDDGKPGLAQMAMDAVISGRVKIIPERYAKSYLDWLGEKRDWPVSRQLWWGHRIPIWTYELRDSESNHAVSSAIKAILGLIGGSEQDISVSANDADANDGRTWHICANSDHASIVMEAIDEAVCRTVPPPTFSVVAAHQTSTPHFHAFMRLLSKPEDIIPANEALTEINNKCIFFKHDPDVLDTWFSSALWPHSTLGWPERTPELEYFYPTSVLITSRDIITLWVARMVLTGLNNVGEVPFRQVFIHPKILDGYGETMSKSKGNGVDPLDIVDKFGADSLRYGLTSMTTETQDVRMPVQFECPHCQALIDQTKKNRELPKVACSKCSKEFSTQWARTDADKAIPRAAVVSERFEVARNFMNKLWNAARFSLINLEGYSPAPVNVADLPVEDRWLLSRLSTVTQEVTAAIEAFRYADAAKSLYDFAWDEFCSFYVEISKSRLQDEAAKPNAQRVLAHTLDVLLRLLHPIMPFITEEIWHNLGQLAPVRGIPEPYEATKHVIIAPWPRAEAAHQDKATEARFATFQAALAALREIRSRQNIPPRNIVEFCIKCDAPTAALLQPMAAYFQSMANATATNIGPSVAPPPMASKSAVSGMEIFVDMKDLIDVPAEIAKNEKEEQKLLGLIKGKEAKLGNASFVDRAPAAVVETERAGLAQYQEQLASVRAALVTLRKS
jgi:valyl-tRNA synthetase